MDGYIVRHNLKLMPNPASKDYKRIYLRVTQSEWIRFQKYKDEGLTTREVLEYSGCPCKDCIGSSMTVYNKNGERIKVTRGILNKMNLK